MHVVATAGHVDHGKSTLVRALTGQDPDRLEEEQDRGLSIQLGYCWSDAVDPSVGEIAFVDVPGHERFLTTTLSGLGPVPVALLVVASDDPWMPQAAEHLAALDALGVRHGLVAVTRSDLADPAPAYERVRRELAGTSLAHAPVVSVSARTGAGLDDLRTTLEQVLSEVPPPDPESPVRLWVDRRFHVRGVGTVVTGTLPAGRVSVGDRLQTARGELRVRGLEALGRERDSVTGTARVALALTGKGLEDLAPGDCVVTPDAFQWSKAVDVSLAGGDAPLPQQPLLHVGSAANAVRARPLGRRHARLTLPGPLPLLLGDRAVLRDPGSRRLWGAQVVDCEGPGLSRRGAARERGEELESWHATVADLVGSRGVVNRSTLQALGASDSALQPGTVVVGDWLVAPAHAAAARAALEERLPPSGVSVEAAARSLDLPVVVVAALISPPLAIEAGRVVRLGGPTELPATLDSALQGLRDDLASSPFAAPDAARLAELGLDPEAVTALHRRGELVHLGSSVVLLPSAPDKALRRLAALEQPFTTSEARQALQTSRRVVLPLLAHLDRTGGTVRLPDDRRRVRQRGPAGGSDSQGM